MPGITVSGPESPVMVYQSATISCMTDLPVTSIEWRNKSSQLSATTSDDAPDLTVLEYTILHVNLDTQEQNFTCVVKVGDTTYTKAVYIQVQGSLYAMFFSFVTSLRSVILW